jgi:hypothetical protein
LIEQNFRINAPKKRSLQRVLKHSALAPTERLGTVLQHDLLAGVIFGMKTHHHPYCGKQQAQCKQMQAYKLMLI